MKISAKGPLIASLFGAVLFFSIFVLPTRPTRAASETALLNSPNQVVVQGDYAYVLNGEAGYGALEIVDISDPLLPTHAGAIRDIGEGVSLSNPQAFDVAGDYAYIGNYSASSLEVINISNPANPVPVGRLESIGRSRAVEVSGNYLYVSLENQTIAVIDISNPSTPAKVSEISPGFLVAPTALFVSGQYLYYGIHSFNGGGAIGIADISDPAHPIQIGGLFGGDETIIYSVASIFVSGDYAYVTDTNAVTIIDISDPVSPTVVSQITNGEGGAALLTPFSIFVDDGHAYVTSYGDRALEILNVSSPASLDHSGSLQFEFDNPVPLDVFVSGNYAYVTLREEDALAVVDISDPAHPFLASIIHHGNTVGTPVEPPTTCCSSVLFLPGLEASRLYLQEGGNENQVWEPNRNLDVEKLYLNTDGSSVNTGIYTKDIIGEGAGIFNIYKSFSEKMGELVNGGKINAWESYAYDWREDIADIVNNGTSYVDGKKSLVESLQNLADNSKDGKVTIIAHSNGGLLAKALLKKLQEDKNSGINDLIDKVDVLILVASPQIGTAMAVPALLHGFDQNILWGWFMDEVHARELGRNMPSAYGLLPSMEYINRVEASPVTFIDTVLPSSIMASFIQNYGNVIDSYSEYTNFLFGSEGRNNPLVEQLNLPIIASQALFNKAESLHEQIDQWTPPATLRVIEVAGWGLDTVASFEYSPICTQSNGITCQQYTLDERPRFTIDGDKTVVVPSAHYIGNNVEKYWVDFRNYNSILKVNREHKDILEVDSLDNLIQSVIEEESIALDPTLKNIQPVYSGNKMRLSIHSPATIDAYDNEGNHTGKICSASSDFCEIEENIPNSLYMEFGEGKYLNLSEEEFSKIVIQGTGDGTFTYESEKILPDETSITTIFKDIPVTLETTGEVTVNPQGDLILELDQNGDEIVDVTSLAVEGETKSMPYNFSGFLPPINAGADRSVFKAGSTVPVKFQLKDYQGNIFQTGTPPVWENPKRGASMSNAVDEAVYTETATTGTTYKWDSVALQYIYNWQTKKTMAGYWYTISVELDDRNIYSVIVGLK